MLCWNYKNPVMKKLNNIRSMCKTIKHRLFCTENTTKDKKANKITEMQQNI